jgi:hypothetical protein
MAVTTVAASTVAAAALRAEHARQVPTASAAVLATTAQRAARRYSVAAVLARPALAPRERLAALAPIPAEVRDRAAVAKGSVVAAGVLVVQGQPARRAGTRMVLPREAPAAPARTPVVMRSR